MKPIKLIDVNISKVILLLTFKFCILLYFMHKFLLAMCRNDELIYNDDYIRIMRYAFDVSVIFMGWKINLVN